MRKGEAIRGFWMAEESRIEIQSQSFGFGPFDPVAEMLDSDGITLRALGPKFSIDRMEIDAMLAGDE